MRHILVITCFLGLATLLGCASREQPQTTNAVALVALDSRINVGGEVHAPGYYPWTSGLRLTDAIANAGGLTVFAVRSRIQVKHADGKAEKCDYNLALKDKSDDPMLRPGDAVFISSKMLIISTKMLIGMSADEARPVADSWSEFVERIE